MTDRNVSVLSDLAVLARDIVPVASSRIFAAVYSKNRVISYGWNQMKSHPFQAQWSKNDDAIFWHAETHAIYNALRVCDEDELRKMTLYIARSRRPEDAKTDKWTWGNCRPCEGCISCVINTI